jgi:hypothetical protein
MKPAVEGPVKRYLPDYLTEQVAAVFEILQEVHDTDRGWVPSEFGLEETSKMQDLVRMPFYTDEEELEMFKKFRAIAVDIEQAVFNLMTGEGNYPGAAMQDWRKYIYKDLLDKSRELSVVLAPGEIDE